MNNLNNKQTQFCREYLVDINATQAAIRAGYSVRSADRIGSRLMSKDEVKLFIKKLMVKQVKRTEVKADDVIKEYAAIGFVDIKDYYTTLYMIHYVKSDDRKGNRVLRKYGSELTSTEYNKVSLRHKIYYSAVERLIPIEELTSLQRSAIASISYDKRGNKILKLYNKQSSLDSLGKHLGMFIDRKEVEHSGVIMKRIINVNPTKDK